MVLEFTEYGLVASAVFAVVLAFAYRMTGITDNRDLIIGAFASQSCPLPQLQ